ncbi:MAG: hypothetical protein KDA92_09765, partial [Planctomycetales bacterium]|nr:hypothetical protein [Planctomycetales bacterium]
MLEWISRQLFCTHRSCPGNVCRRSTLPHATFASLVRVFAVGLLVVSSTMRPSLLQAEALDEAAQRELFESRIRPLLIEHCYECHSAKADKLQASLLLDSREGMLRGGDSGPCVVPGDAASSLLIGALRHETVEMPPRRRLPDEQVADVERWIQQGAWWPASENTTPTAVAAHSGFDWRSRKAAHWAWQPPQPQTVPQVANRQWCRSPI